MKESRQAHRSGRLFSNLSAGKDMETGRTGGNGMKLLVIGGSYFLGRVFVTQAAGEHDITVVNQIGRASCRERVYVSV